MNRLIVVGAGPAGMTLALQLARAGRVVTLIDARRDFARSLRGDALMPCGLEALARMGLWPLLEQLPQRQLAGWGVWIERRELFRVAEPLGALQPCRLVSQQQLLEALLQAALACPTFTWIPGVGVSGLLQTDAGTAPGHPGASPRVCGVRLADGRELKADLVIGCDGRDSTVRRAAGLSLEPRGDALHLAWLVMTGEPTVGTALGNHSPAQQDNPAGDELATGEIAEGRGVGAVSRSGYPRISAAGDPTTGEPTSGDPTAGDPTSGDFLTLVGGGAIASACRGAGGELQLGWLLRPGEPLPERSAADWAEAIARMAPPALADLLRRGSKRLSRPQRFTVQVGLARRWQRPGVLLLGDAAHPMSPIRAQGINQALRDSVVAAKELLQLTNEQLACPGSLDQASAHIEAQRRPEIERLQGLQLSEARQGHWIGHNPLLRQGLALGAPLLGPVAQRVWMARQRPLREGAVWL